MTTPARKHVVELALRAAPARVFAMLVTPSDIRGWWGASRAIVTPREGGTWSAAWGEREDDPDYVVSARMRVFDPPHRLVFDRFDYFAKSGPLPFEADFVTSYTVEPRSAGSLLRIVQDGFPADRVADSHYAACEAGWRATFEGIRQHLGEA